MFTVGSRVVHPCYGAGTIVRIQEKSIGNTTRVYYVINTVNKSMQLMVPVKGASDAGLRQVLPVASLREMLVACHDLPKDGEINPDLRSRQSDMREHLKSGNLAEVVGVVRKLYYLNNSRPLGTVDRQLFDQGKELLAGELALATGSELLAAMQEVEDNLAVMLHEEG
jgi:CarD family transcriptional regulator